MNAGELRQLQGNKKYAGEGGRTGTGHRGTGPLLAIRCLGLSIFFEWELLFGGSRERCRHVSVGNIIVDGQCHRGFGSFFARSIVLDFSFADILFGKCSI